MWHECAEGLGRSTLRGYAEIMVLIGKKWFVRETLWVGLTFVTMVTIQRIWITVDGTPLPPCADFDTLWCPQETESFGLEMPTCFIRYRPLLGKDLLHNLQVFLTQLITSAATETSVMFHLRLGGRAKSWHRLKHITRKSTSMFFAVFPRVKSLVSSLIPLLSLSQHLLFVYNRPATNAALKARSVAIIWSNMRAVCQVVLVMNQK